METFVRAIDRLTGATGVIGAWLVLPLVFCACFEVFSRYVLGDPTIWAFEVGYMLTGANFLIGMALALREQAHIRIEVLYAYFPLWLRTIVDSLTYLVIILPISAWLSFGLYDYALQAYLSGESSGRSAWSPLVWPFRAVFTISFCLLGLQALAELLRCILIFRGRPSAVERTAAGDPMKVQREIP